MAIDGFRFLGGPTRKVMCAWIEREPQATTIPWTPLARPLAEARVALLSTAGIALASDPPFDQEGERRDPWWGDPTHRLIPAGATEADVRLYHMHIDTRPAEEDLDCVLPLRRLAELVADGVVGSVAPRHVSTMGYVLDTTALERDTTPSIAETLRRDEVNLALLVPV